MNDLNCDALQQSIAANVASVRKRIEAAASRSSRDIEEISLIAVSKNFPADAVRAAYACGLRDFGENRVQEAEAKSLEIQDIRGDLTLHLIGHLQTNKVKYALKLFDIIHSIDSLHLAREISKRAIGLVPVLIEVNITGEESKFGLSSVDLKEVITAISGLPNVDVKGLMTVAPYVDDPEKVRPVFHELRCLNESFGFNQLSMGMTDDFEVAIEEGATMVRVGRAIFGERRY